MNLISREGERWDGLCLRAYGVISQSAMDTLRAANTEAARASVGFVLPAGYPITVPNLPLSQRTQVEVAPWQR